MWKYIFGKNAVLEKIVLLWRVKRQIGYMQSYLNFSLRVIQFSEHNLVFRFHLQLCFEYILLRKYPTQMYSFVPVQIIPFSKNTFVTLTLYIALNLLLWVTDGIWNVSVLFLLKNFQDVLYIQQPRQIKIL